MQSIPSQRTAMNQSWNKWRRQLRHQSIFGKPYKKTLQEDTQEHILVCSRLDGSNMDLELIHASSVEQSELARQFCGLMNQRTTLLEEQSDSSSCCRPGANLDPSFLGAPAADDIL